jgi:hypothetical protein
MKVFKALRRIYSELNLRAHGELCAEQFWLKILIYEQFDDAGCVLFNHNLTPQAGLLIVRIQDTTGLFEGLSNLREEKSY